MTMRSKRLSLVYAAAIAGCFSPNDPSPEDTATDTMTSTADDTTPSASGSMVTSVSNTSPATSDPTGDPTGNTTTSGPDETDSDPTSETETETNTTGDPPDPVCGDGTPTAGELCFDGKSMDFPVTRFPVDVALGDITINGLLDIVSISTGDTDNPRMDVLEADGIGGFVAGDSRPAPAYPGRVKVADADEDNDDDIFVIGSGGISQFRNSGSFLSTVFDGTFNGSWELADIHIVDVNGDDEADVVANEAYGHGYYIGSITGGNFTMDADAYQGLPIPGEGAAGMIVGAFSFDGDADPDIIALNQYYAEVWVTTNDGTGDFTEQFQPTVCAGEFDGVRHGDWGDFDDDGNTDIVVTCDTGDVSIAFDDGTGSFGTFDTLALAGPHRPIVVDLDGDNDQDLLVTSYSVDRAVLFLNDGTGAFELSDVTFQGVGPVYGAAVGDLNDDGALDVIVAADDGAEGQIQIFFADP